MTRRAALLAALPLLLAACGGGSDDGAAAGSVTTTGSPDAQTATVDMTDKLVFAPPTVQARANGSERDFQHRGDLVVLHVVDEIQGADHPVLLRQRGNRGVDLLVVQALEDGCGRIRIAARDPERRSEKV